MPLTLKALQFSEWGMPAASTGVSTSSGYVTAGGADPTIVSYRRIPLCCVAMTGQLGNHGHDPSDNSGTNPEQPGVC